MSRLTARYYGARPTERITGGLSNPGTPRKQFLQQPHPAEHDSVHVRHSRLPHCSEN